MITDADKMIKEEGPVINGVRMDDISLNSSRSRRRRDSQGSPKHQRKNMANENGGTDEIRRVSSAAYARDISKGQDREEPSVILRKKGKDNDRLSGETKDKRGSSIVLDVNSILDELVTAGDDALELPEKSSTRSSKTSSSRLGTERKSAPRSTPSPILRVESADPPQPKRGNALETTVIRSSRLIRSGTDEKSKGPLSKTTTSTTGSSVSTSSSYTTDKRPPVSPARSPARVRGSESTGTANTVSSPVEEKSMQSSPRSPDLKEAEIKDGQKSSSSSRRIYSSRTSKGLQNENEEQEESSSYRSRTRSNAISKADAQQYSPKVSAKNEKIEEEEPPSSPRLRDKSKRRSHIDSVVEMRSQRTSSWSRMRQLVNSKQLGMFYHDRRSQAFDHDSQDEDWRVNSDRGSSLERSDSSASAPRSPTVVSPRSRESRGLSPGIKSPLASKHRPGFDEAHASLLEKKEREESGGGRGSVPATPSTPSSATLAPPREQDDEEPQVSSIDTKTYHS